MSFRFQYSLVSKGVDLTGLLGGHKRRLDVWGMESPSGVQRRSPGRRSGGRSPQKLKLFCETAHNICIKIQQTTVLLLLLLDKINNITFKILGGHYHGRSPFINIGGHVFTVP